jgi:hypothetical protein
LPFDTSLYQKHHTFPFGNLVLCDGSRNGKPLTAYFNTKPKTCTKCGYFNGKGKSCKIGYFVKDGNATACRQAIRQGEKRGY